MLGPKQTSTGDIHDPALRVPALQGRRSGGREAGDLCGDRRPEEGLSGGYDDGFIVTFEDEMVRDYYLKHPKHVEVGERIVGATDGGLAGILVFDLAH
jgi:hypothetical protein